MTTIKALAKTNALPLPNGGAAGSGQSGQLFEMALRVLRANILGGNLHAGLVVQESALAERLSMSRAPVSRALALLESEGLISRFSGRGYVVGNGQATPRRENLREIDMDLELLDETAGRPNWFRLHDVVEQEISRTLVFGEYRINETLMAQHYNVSRTVVRDVLGRLQERGLISKSASSRWIVEPLTAQKIRNKFELRIILEGAALQKAEHDFRKLARLQRDLQAAQGAPGLTPENWFTLSDRFTDLAIRSASNSDLAHYITANSKALQASQRALFALGLPPPPESLHELQMVIGLLLLRTPEAAQTMFHTHLAKAQNRTIAQLKIVAVMAAPPDLAPYLQSTSQSSCEGEA